MWISQVMEPSQGTHQTVLSRPMYNGLIVSLIRKYSHVHDQSFVVHRTFKSSSRLLTKSNDVIRNYGNRILQGNESGTVVFRRSSDMMDFGKYTGDCKRQQRQQKQSGHSSGNKWSPQCCDITIILIYLLLYKNQECQKQTITILFLVCYSRSDASG